MSEEQTPVAETAVEIGIQPAEVLPELTEDEILKMTQQVRHSFVHESLKSNKGQFPIAPDEQKVILTALKDMDAQVLKKRSIDSKEKIAMDDRLAAEAVERARLRLMEDHAAHRRQVDKSAPARVRPNIIDQALPELKLAHQETAVGVFSPTFEEFMEGAGGDANILNKKAEGEEEEGLQEA